VLEKVRGGWVAPLAPPVTVEKEQQGIREEMGRFERFLKASSSASLAISGRPLQKEQNSKYPEASGQMRKRMRSPNSSGILYN
jgi:hypothetical protein